jgi:hypothetical protein
VKMIISALSIAALVAAAPTVLAQGVSSKFKKHHSGVFGYAPFPEMRANSSKQGYPRAYGSAPGQPSAADRDLEASRQAGGGGGGGGGGM